MGVGLPPLDFTECLNDSPYFRENLHKHEKELEKTNQHIKRIIKEVKDLITAATQLGNAQKSFANCLNSFTFEFIGEKQTDDERVICQSLETFSDFIRTVEEERKRMLENANELVVKPLEYFRKKHIGGVKNEKKKFEKQTAKFCQNQERYLNLTTKKTNSLQEADASVDMEQRHFYQASMDYVYLIQEVHERKKFEFVETLLQFMFAWLTFYHQGYEVAKDSKTYMNDLQQKIQKTRANFNDFSSKLKRRMAEVQKLEEPVKNMQGCKEGYLFLLEKKMAFGVTWTKYYCKYNRGTKSFLMLPYNQLTTKSLPPIENLIVASCVRRMSDSIEKRFCFDMQFHGKSESLTFQALSEKDRKSWLDVLDGTEPTYSAPTPNLLESESQYITEDSIKFLQRCINVVEQRGMEEQGLYRVSGVTSKINKFLTHFLEKKKSDNMDDQEWETKTVTSALKNFLRNFPEPLMTYKYHAAFVEAAKNESKQKRVNEMHSLLYRIPKKNFDMLKILIKHLTNVAAKSSKNLMGASNLSVCFGPTLLRTEEETVASIMDLKFCNIVIEILIDNYDLLFNYPPIKRSHDEEDIYQNTAGTSGFMQIAQPTYARTNYDENMAPGDRRPLDLRVPYRQNLERTHYDPVSSSMYNVMPPVHNDSNGGPPMGPPNMYDMSQSENPYSRATRINNPYLFNNTNYGSQNISSQSDTNIPNMGNNRYNNYNANYSSSSNESVSSATHDSNIQALIPQKTRRSQLFSGQNVFRSPGHVRVRTLYACVAENDGELSFSPNQIITNVKPSQEPGWIEGSLNGKTGLIPENYVEALP